jgi:hypothetical protein
MVYGNPSPMVVRMARMVSTCRSPINPCQRPTWLLLEAVAVVLTMLVAVVRVVY